MWWLKLGWALALLGRRRGGEAGRCLGRRRGAHAGLASEGALLELDEQEAGGGDGAPVRLETVRRRRIHGGEGRIRAWGAHSRR